MEAPPSAQAPPATRDACAACLSAAGRAHAEHPLRRMVLGPLPVEMISSATLLAATKEREASGAARNVGSSDRSAPFPSLRRRFSTARPFSPRLSTAPTLRRVLSAGSLSEAAAAAAEEEEEPAEPAAPPASPGAPESAPLAQDVPTTSSLEGRAAGGGGMPPGVHPSPRTAPPMGRSVSGDSFFSDVPRHRRPFAARRRPAARRGEASDMLRTVSYFSSHSVPPPTSTYRDASFQHLDEAVRAELEGRAAFLTGHHRMVGDSFVVGDLFWRTLQATLLDAPPVRGARMHPSRSLSFVSMPHSLQTTQEEPPSPTAFASPIPRVQEEEEVASLPAKAPHPLASPVVLPVQAEGAATAPHEAKGASAPPCPDAASQGTEAYADASEARDVPPFFGASSDASDVYRAQQAAPHAPCEHKKALPALPPRVLPKAPERRPADLPAAAPAPDAPPRRAPTGTHAPLRPILRPSGSYREPSSAAENCQGWEATRERLAASERRPPLHLQRLRVVQQLEQELHDTMHKKGRGAELYAPQEQAALPRSRSEHDALRAARPRPPGALPPGAPSPHAPTPPSPVRAASASSASLATLSADADSDAPMLPAPARSVHSARSARSLASWRSMRSSRSRSRLAQLKEPRLLLDKMRVRPRQVSFAPSVRPARSTPTLLSVHERDLPTHLVQRGESVPVGAGDAAPPSAAQVLAREADPPLPTAPARRLLLQRARERAEPLQSVMRPVLKRDRMLLKIQHAPHHSVSESFNALEARKYDIRSFQWTEYMVVLRPGRLELWSEATVRGRLLGNTRLLKLRHAVLLEKGVVSLSMYSEVDHLFCLTFPRSVYKQSRTTHMRLFRRTGSVIFILDARAASTAADWMWVLHRELGGRVPPHLFVHVPGISVRIRVPVPELPPHTALASNDAYEDGTYGPLADARALASSQITSAEVVRSVERIVKVMPNWARLAERMRRSGIRARLAWRSGAVYNWVHDDTTIDGQPRFWSVLAGSLCTAHGRLPTLELLGSVHYPTYALHPNGHRLQEPMGIEGIVWRLRPVSGAMTRVYFSTQDSHLYLMRESRAFPPDVHEGIPLDTELEAPYMTRTERLAQHAAAFHAREQVRQQLQIRYCEGFVDLREVTAIRSVGTGVTLSTNLSPTAAEMAAQLRPGAELHTPHTHALYDYDGTRTALDALLRFPADDGGVGDAGLHRASDRSYVHALRQVDLLLANGRRVSFECASAALAREWMVRLYQLTIYWSCRRKSDTSLLSSLEEAQRPHPHVPARSHARSPEELAEHARLLMWNWCLIDGCRAVRFSGRLFWRPEKAYNFVARFFVVCGGALVPFKLISSMRSATSRQNEGVLFKRLEPPILLRDAYVYNGRISDRQTKARNEDASGTHPGAQAMPGGGHLLPRLYPDGLMSYDDDDDCIFALRVRTHADALSAQQNVFRLRNKGPMDTGEFIPGLADKMYGEILFRARTVMERNLWIRAIETEIENLARSEPEREARVRDRGDIV